MVYLGDGWGNFQKVLIAGQCGAPSPNELVLGDINGDGHVDLAGAYGGANKLWFGDGKGTFTEASASSLGAHQDIKLVGIGRC